MSEQDKQELHELKRSVTRIEEALLGNEEYQREGLIAIVKRHDELFVKMSHLGRFTLSMLGIGAAIGTAMTWLVHHAKDILNLFKD
jgi:hypothetical protein